MIQYWAVDPGVQQSALAVFTGKGELTNLHWLNSWSTYPRHLHLAAHTIDLSIEKPRIYPGMPSVDANDLIDLAEVVGYWRREIPAPSYSNRSYYPQEWKAQVKKPIHHSRIWQNLTPTERALLPGDTFERIEKGCKGGAYTSKVHNLLDAIGIGLFRVGRLGVGGVRIR